MIFFGNSNSSEFFRDFMISCGWGCKRRPAEPDRGGTEARTPRSETQIPVQKGEFKIAERASAHPNGSEKDLPFCISNFRFTADSALQFPFL